MKPQVCSIAIPSIKFAFAILILSQVSCANYFTRKECEKTNWFQHGEDVAMKGQNLENDKFLNDCRRAEAQIGESALDQGFKKGRANYCEPETVKQTGKKGEPLSIDMCDGSNPKLLRAKHLEGLKQYCLPSNGEDAGASGHVYQNVCPKDMEGKFLVEYKKGRKKFLAAEIDSRESQIDDMDRDIQDLDRSVHGKTVELASMGDGGNKVVKRTRRVSNGYSSQTVEDDVTVEEDQSTKMRRDDLQRDIDGLNWQIKTKRNNQAQVRDEIRKLRSEMFAL
jgi:hypothetical protein